MKKSLLIVFVLLIALSLSGSVTINQVGLCGTYDGHIGICGYYPEVVCQVSEDSLIGICGYYP